MPPAFSGAAPRSGALRVRPARRRLAEAANAHDAVAGARVEVRAERRQAVRAAGRRRPSGSPTRRPSRCLRRRAPSPSRRRCAAAPPAACRVTRAPPSPLSRSTVPSTSSNRSEPSPVCTTSEPDRSTPRTPPSPVRSSILPATRSTRIEPSPLRASRLHCRGTDATMRAVGETLKPKRLPAAVRPLHVDGDRAARLLGPHLDGFGLRLVGPALLDFDQDLVAVPRPDFQGAVERGRARGWGCPRPGSASPRGRRRAPRRR